MGGQSWGSPTLRHPVAAGKPHREVGNEARACNDAGMDAPKLMDIQGPLGHEELGMEPGPRAEGDDEPRAGEMGALA